MPWGQMQSPGAKPRIVGVRMRVRVRVCVRVCARARARVRAIVRKPVGVFVCFGDCV